MKILIITSGFFPGKKYGGPPVSIDNFCSLMNEFECYIVCKDHDNGDSKRYSCISDGWNSRNNCQVNYLSDAEFNKTRFERTIQDIEPDVIYLQSMFQRCTLSVLRLAKKYNLKVMLAPRGELCAGAFRKKYKKLPYINLLKILKLMNNVHFQSTSHEETAAIKKWLDISNDYIHYLPNIPSIPKKEYDFPTKRKGYLNVIFLSRIHPKKNLLFTIECLAKCRGNIQYDIYGPIEDKEYWSKCKHVIQSLPSNINTRYHGLISHNDVHKTFSKYDLFFFPTLSENFGHVIAESLMVGCPVLISDQTPFTDLNDKNAGKAIALENKEEFISTIYNYVCMDSSDINNIRTNAKNYINDKLDIKTLKKVYYDVFEKFSS